MRIRLYTCCTLAAFAILAPALGWAQSSASPFDGYTPGQTMPSSPFGTIGLSGLETINPASGMLNVNIPLLIVKGRGSVSVPITIHLGSEVWNTRAVQYQYNCNQYGCQTGYGYVVTTGWNPLPVDFGQSSLMFRKGGDYCSGSAYHNTLTRGTFTAPDGTETEFVDQQTNGTPEPPGYNRGTVFIADDGSYAKFTSSSAISDTTSCGAGTLSATGTLILRDGTTYTISGGSTTQIRDRNGNITAISSTRITDSLNRAYTLSTSSSQSQIQYSGAGGGSRTITVKYDWLGSHLASGESLQTFNQLWPQIPTSTQGSNLSQQFNPNNIVSEIDLPDGSKYTFTYHSYGDVAQITLPTGGVIEYDYNSSTQWVSASPAALYLLTRSLRERREKLNGAVVSRTDFPGNEIDRYDGSNNLLAKETYTIGSVGAMPSSANNYNAWNYNQKTTINYYHKDGSTLLESQTISYAQNNCKVNCSTVQTVTTSLNSGASVKKSTYTYDQYNNLTDQKDYAWGSGAPGSLLRDTQITPVTDSSYANINILNLPLAIKVYDGSNNLYGFTQYGYDQYGNPATPIYNCPGVIGHDNANFAGGGPRGNVTTIGQRLISNSTWLNTYQSYDIAGNLINITDANNHTTSFSYNDNYADGTNRNSYGFVTAVSNALGQLPFQSNYDYSTGQPMLTADLRGQYTSYNYGVSGFGIDRISQVNYANGSHTYYSYPSATQAITQQDQASAGDGALKQQTISDGFGRMIETDRFENGTQHIATTQSYDALGRVVVTTNPSRPGDGLNYATTYGYDGLGRTTQVTTADGAATVTSYAGNVTTVTDPAGHKKQLMYDALGQLMQVVEDPGSSPHLNYTTTYTFAADGTLQKVAQGSQTRTFSYDSLQRLATAGNPESGTVSYTYDNVGNVLTKRDDRGITTSNSYDALNRVIQTSYSDGTPAVTYTYDAAPNGRGQLASIGNGNSTTNYTSFDVMGNVLGSNQVTASQTYSFAYAYNLAGALTSETYPSGREVTTGYDGANRVNAVN
ncbi:MAG TPA: hypothetical protein VH601_11090, partial [Bryobacteraceae bacterium]